MGNENMFLSGDPRFLFVLAADVVLRMSEFPRQGREGHGSGR